MAQYPTLSQARYKRVEGDSLQKILNNQLDELGKEVRKLKDLYPKRLITLPYENITKDELRTLLQFESNVKGSFSSFVFIYEYEETFYGEYIATGDGSTTQYNLPVKNGSSISVYNNGVEYEQAIDATSAGDYYITEGIGLYSVDQINFFIAPNAGLRLTCDFTGELAVRARLLDKIKHTTANIYLSLNNAQVNLRGLLWDEV